MALHFLHYNFAQIHKTLRITPAMEAGLSDHVWSYEEIAALASQLETILIDPVEAHWIANVGCFVGSQLLLIPNRGYGCETYSTY